jgi:hypothetical protein
MLLTYTYSKAICVQDPSAVGGPIAGDPFQSSFGEPQAPLHAPTAAAVSARPLDLVQLSWGLQCYPYPDPGARRGSWQQGTLRSCFLCFRCVAGRPATLLMIIGG